MIVVQLQVLCIELQQSPPPRQNKYLFYYVLIRWVNNLQTLTVVTLEVEGLDDINNLLKTLNPGNKLLPDKSLVLAELLEQVLSVWARLHGELEDGSHQHGVVLGEGGIVGLGERLGQLLLLVVNLSSQTDGGELETSHEPQQTLGGGLGLLGLLDEHEILESAVLDGVGHQTVLDLLDVSVHVGLDDAKGGGSEQVCVSEFDLLAGCGIFAALPRTVGVAAV